MLAFSQPLRGVVRRKVPVYFVLLAALLPTGLYVYHTLQEHSSTRQLLAAEASPENSCNISMEQNRLQKSGLTRPLLLTDLPVEEKSLQPLKSSLLAFLDEKRGQGEADQASVYLRKLNNGAWFCINPELQFSPGSMLKVPILITYMKMREQQPDLFDKVLVLHPSMIPNKTQYVEESHIPPGKYKIGDLIQYMIIRSDNYATLLLNMNIDNTLFGNVFADLGLPRPDIRSQSYPMTTKAVGKFMRVLYSSSYLSIKDSEYVLGMLTQTEYKNGLLAGIPENVKVAHKFGESGDGTVFELHESAIIYTDDSPYLLVVMTRGKDISKLPAVLSGVSSRVYNSLKPAS